MTNDTPHEDGPAAAVDGDVRTPGTTHARDADTPGTTGSGRDALGVPTAGGATPATEDATGAEGGPDHGTPHPQHRTPVDLAGIGDDAPADPEERLERTVAVTTLGTTGVHALGTPLARALGAVGTRLGSDSVPGVTLSRSQGTTVVEVAVVAEWPAKVVEVADAVREQVADAVTQLVDGPVRVDVTVTDVHGPFDDEETALDRARDAAGRAGERVRDAASTAGDRAREASAAAGDRAREAGAAASSAGARAADALRDATAQAADTVREGAVTAGDAVRDAAATAGDRASEASAAAGDKGSQAGDALRDAASDARDAVRDAADAAADRTADALDATADVVEGSDDTAARATSGTSAGASASGAADAGRTATGSGSGSGSGSVATDDGRTVEVVVDGGDRPDVEVTVTVTDGADGTDAGSASDAPRAS